MAAGVIIGILATLYTTRESNKAAKSAATFQGQQATAEAAQLELQAQAEKTQAESEQLDRQRTLQRIMAAQDAVFGSSGADSLSGSFKTVQTSDTRRAAEASRLNQSFQDTRQVGFQNNIRNIGNEALFTRNAARIARRTNTVAGAGKVISIGANAYTGAKTA